MVTLISNLLRAASWHFSIYMLTSSCIIGFIEKLYLFLALSVKLILLNAFLDVCYQLSIPLKMNNKFTLFTDFPCILLKGKNSVALGVKKKIILMRG